MNEGQTTLPVDQSFAVTINQHESTDTLPFFQIRCVQSQLYWDSDIFIIVFFGKVFEKMHEAFCAQSCIW